MKALRNPILMALFVLGVVICAGGCTRDVANFEAAPVPELIFYLPTKPSGKERLELKVISTEHARHRFTHEIYLGGQKFRSLDAVIMELSRLPKGSEVYYDYSCLGVLNRPLAQYEELVAFQQRCDKIGVVLVLEYGTQLGRVKRVVSFQKSL